MAFFILPALFVLILFLDKNSYSSTRERAVRRLLVIAAILLSFPTARALGLDHVGASLSGLVSLFIGG